MPGPVFMGRCVTEIKVPKKTTFQYECERCNRTWFSDTEVSESRVTVSFTGSDGEVVKGDIDTLCSSCEKTVKAAVQTVILKAMKKISPVKSEAKKESV